MKRLIYFMLTAFMAVSVTSCTTIDSGSVGIRFKKWDSDAAQHGGVIGTCKGFVWFNPITQSIYEYPTFVQRKVYDNIKVNAKDGAIFTISPIIAYRLNSDKAQDVFVKYRKSLEEIEDGYMRTCIYDAYRTCGNAYTSDEIMSNRQKFEQEVRVMLEKTLNEEGFEVSEFTAQITPPESLAKSIDMKNEAVQNALRAENQVLEAQATAKINVAKAEGEAAALKIKGDGEAYYNRVVAASLSALLIQQDAIEKWDGKMPISFGGQGALPLVNIK